MKETIDRIEKMEQLLNDVQSVTAQFSKSLHEFEAVQDKVKQLSDYYGSSIWFYDLDLDEKGQLPSQLKRGVLSQDGIDHQLLENQMLAEGMLAIAQRILKRKY